MLRHRFCENEVDCCASSGYGVVYNRLREIPADELGNTAEMSVVPDIKRINLDLHIKRCWVNEHCSFKTV